MNAAVAGQRPDTLKPPVNQPDEVGEQGGTTTASRGKVVSNKSPPRRHRQSVSSNAHQQRDDGPSQQQHGQKCPHQRRLSQHHVSPLLPSLTIFHPRPYEEIYAEQAYLSLTLQSHTNRLCDLIAKFHMAEEDSIYGESRTVKRQARRQIGILRSQIKYAAEQEKTIFARLGDLLVEAKSREALDVARQRSLRHWTNQQPFGGPSSKRPSVAESHLNGATAEFVPGNMVRDQRADSAVVVSTDSDDGKDMVVDGGERDDVRKNSESEMSFGGNLEPEAISPRSRRFSGSRDLEPVMLRRQSSMPNLGIAWSS